MDSWLEVEAAILSFREEDWEGEDDESWLDNPWPEMEEPEGGAAEDGAAPREEAGDAVAPRGKRPPLSLSLSHSLSLSLSPPQRGGSP